MVTFEPIEARFVLTVKEPQCTYQECLGPDAWSGLPEAVRDALSCPMRAEGKADVINGASRVSRWLARLCGLPREGKSQTLTLETSWDGDRMVWRRVFNGRAFVSKQVIGPGRVTDSVRFSQLEFVVETDGSKVIFKSDRATVFGIALPRAVRPVSTATLQPAGKGWQVKVSVTAPLVGLLCEYVAQTENR